MKAIILAAGEGKRLRPLTDKIPKCMVELFGKPLLKWQIETFYECNISDISVVTGYQSGSINYPDINYFQNKRFNETNMLETLFCAKSKLVDSVIVSYGDIIFEKKILEKLINSNDDYAVVIDKNWEKYWRIRFENPLHDAESLLLDDDGYIKDIGQKVNDINRIQGQYIGLMKFQNKAINEMINFYEKMKEKSIDAENPLNPEIPFQKSYMTDFLQGLIKENYKIKAIPVSNGWLELDSIDDYEIYQKKNNDESLNEFISLLKSK